METDVTRSSAELVRTIPLRREIVDVTTTVVSDNDVVVRTDVLVETQTFTVDLTREELVVERRSSGSDLPVELFRLPLRHEEVVLDKRVVVTADVDVRKERRTDREVVAVEVRHEVLVRDDDPNGVISA